MSNGSTDAAWVVAQVTVGKEDEIRESCADMLSKSILEDVFVPKHVRFKRYKGEWHKETRPLYSGYVFMVTPDPSGLEKALTKVPGYHRLLKADDVILTINPEEKAFIRRIAGRDNTVDISKLNYTKRHFDVESLFFASSESPKSRRNGLNAAFSFAR